MASEQDIFNRFVAPSTKKKGLALNEDWFMKYVSDVLGRAGDYYFAEVVKSVEIEQLGKKTVVTCDEKD